MKPKVVIRAALLLGQFFLLTPAMFGDAVDDYVQSEMKQRNIPGISIAVVRDGKVLKADGYGLANVEHNVPAKPETVYQLADVTKSFTATAIMLLVEDGKLGLDDRINRYLNIAPATWSNITVRHLLTHTAGIKGFTSLPEVARNSRKDFTPEELIGLVKEMPLYFEPGEKMRYSSTGYFLLGMLIEKVTGKSYGEFLQERIFKPLDMANTRMNDSSAVISNRAMGYSIRDKRLLNVDHISPTLSFSAGALVSTVRDLAKWDAALRTDKLLSRSRLEQMWSPLKLIDGRTQPYGFGWSLGKLKGHRYVDHGGEAPGFAPHIIRFLEDKLTVIVLATGPANAQAMARRIAGFYLPDLMPVAFVPPKKNGPGDPDAVDAYVLGEMENQHIPGVSLAVLKAGRFVKSEGYGWANVEGKVPVNADTVFQLQSMTKSFTASAIMMLVEEGKLGLDDPVRKHISSAPESWSGVTVRHLLTHTSGIKDFINEPTVELDKDITEEAVVASLEKLSLNFNPGERYSYSNTGYHLLGMIIHKLTGKTWGEFLRDRVFTPLEMKSTDIYSSTCTLTNRASGYIWAGSGLEPGMYVAPTILGYAGGGMLSTIQDLAHWDAALYRDTPLKKPVLQQMWTPAKFNNGRRAPYGFGWFLDDFRGHRLVSHTGAHMTGFRSAFLHFPDDQLTVIVLANQRGATPEEIARGVACRFLPGLLLSRLLEKPDAEPVLTKQLKSCLMDLARKKDSPLLTEGFRADYARSSTRAESLAARMEELKAFTFLACEDVQTRGIERLGAAVQRVCFYKMDAGNETRYYTFYLTREGKVAYYQSSVE